jgi:hypothetical protein
MMPVHSRVGKLFLTHRLQVFEQYGKYLFKEEPDADKRKKRVKQITNGYDMGSKLDTWAKHHGNPHERSVGKMTAKVAHNGGMLRVSLEAYYKEQQLGAQWIEAHSTSMQEITRSQTTLGTRAWETVSRTTQSYILQEAEAVSRLAKIKKARELGLTVFNLQHDEIATGWLAGGAPPTHIAHLLEEAATAASGYTFIVVDETLAPATDVLIAD